MITQERLKEVLDYNSETGIFTWIEAGSGRNVGDIAGCLDNSAYVVIRINGKNHYAHRLAILYTDGYLPETTVDHIDRVRWHNWRLNLREASRQCQTRNSGMNKRNTSGIKGVSLNQQRGKKWKVGMRVDNSHRHLGYYDSLLEAAYARYAAEQCLGYPDCDTSSSAKQYIDAQGRGNVTV